MANRDNQVGSIELLEMEFMNTVRMKPPALLGGERGRNETARVRVVVEPFEMRPHPGRNRGAARRSHALQLREIRHRQNPGHNWYPDPRSTGAVAETQEYVDIEKELRDCT